jgi:RNA polymerase sigma-70 factor, ECF subfamily
LAAAEILNACLKTGSEAAWTAFVKRFQPLIASSISRVVSRHGSPNTDLIDDLIHETYLLLCRDNCRCLRDFQAHHEEAIFGYIKVIATSVALDHFRTRSTQKRRGEVEDDGTHLEASSPSTAIEHITLLKELDQHLASSESVRNRTIFWLYYRQGYTAKDIAAIPNLGLTQKGVESCIYRLTQILRSVVGSSVARSTELPKGNPPHKALGGME